MSSESLYDKENKDIEYLAVIKSQSDAERIGYFDSIIHKNFSDKCGNQLILYVLDGINQIQTKLKNDINGIDKYPENDFRLLKEKINPSNNKRNIIKSNITSKKGKLPLKKGEKKTENIDNEIIEDNN